MRYTQKVLIAGITGISVAATAWAALPGGGPAEAWTIFEIKKETATVGSAIASFGSSFGAATQAKFEMLMSALAIATKQESLSGQVQADGIHKASQQMVSGIGAVKTNGDVIKSYLSFSPTTGQGVDPCGTLAKTKTLDRAFQSLPHASMIRMSEIDSAPGRMVTSRARALEERLINHRKQFCTEAEAKAGVCSLSDLPGGDTNAALLFEPAPAGSLQSEARKAFIAHVSGEPDQLIPAASAKSANGQHYAFLKQRKDALLSVPAYSLAMIDIANTQSEEMGGRSPNEILKLRVNQYFGGKESLAWSKALTAQTSRGLLVEQAKMAGLETWLRWQQLEQGSRMEANMATLLLASAERMGGKLSAQHARILADATAREVR